MLEELLLQHRLKANPPLKTPPVKKVQQPARGIKKWEPKLPSKMKAAQQPVAKGNVCPQKAGPSVPIRPTTTRLPTRNAAASRPQAAANQPSSSRLPPRNPAACRPQAANQPPSSRLPPKTSACRPQVGANQPPVSRQSSTRPPISGRPPLTRPSQSRLNPRADIGAKESASVTSNAGRCPQKAPSGITAKGGACAKPTWK